MAEIDCGFDGNLADFGRAGWDMHPQSYLPIPQEPHQQSPQEELARINLMLENYQILNRGALDETDIPALDRTHITFLNERKRQLLASQG
jgi:hypothetical protein